jgi:hypothetical protein
VFPLYNNTARNEIVASMPKCEEWVIKDDWAAPGSAGLEARSPLSRMSSHVSSSVMAERDTNEEQDDASSEEKVPSLLPAGQGSREAYCNPGAIGGAVGGSSSVRGAMRSGASPEVVEVADDGEDDKDDASLIHHQSKVWAVVEAEAT